MKGIPPKLRAITDEFLKSKGITQKIAPISILDVDFQKDVKARTRSKTKAAEVEHAIRHFIDLNIDEDPELFASFAAELEQILQEFKDNWDRIYDELEKLRQKILAKEKEQTYGLDRKKQMPVFRILKAELFDNRNLSEDEIAQAVNLTQHVFNQIAQEVRTAGFWSLDAGAEPLEGGVAAPAALGGIQRLPEHAGQVATIGFPAHGVGQGKRYSHQKAIT